ncbi:TerC/Alx family metal homeostasis membrane protein [Candidatus Woesebacteria bacterium]|nr:TerC/Alx family metal homeostasis membrane protein [Candidatus Woesebacteria bacterium]
MTISIELFILFVLLITGFLIVDLVYFNKQAHEVSTRSATAQTVFWIVLAFLFAGLIYHFLGVEKASEFVSAYLTEKMLSVDNLFVIMLIFSFFKLESMYHHKVLFYGIIGAIVLRAIFIGAGSYIIEQFHWILYIFGGLLVYTGAKLFSDKKEEHVDFSKNRLIMFVQKYLPFTTDPHQGKFIIKKNNQRYLTTLFLIVLLVESTDLFFAFDSIPAAFAISQDPFIIFTANIFAVMGLRALFFLIEGFIQKFHHLQKGLACILVFIGAKMLAALVHIHISSRVSLVVILLMLALSFWLSILLPPKKHVVED